MTTRASPFVQFGGCDCAFGKDECDCAEFTPPPTPTLPRFYFRKGKWHVTFGQRVVRATDWWNAINQVNCMNDKLRTAQAPSPTYPPPPNI
jgi:hypothetical protein